MQLKKGALPRDDDGSRPELEDYLLRGGLKNALPKAPNIVDRGTGDRFQMYLNDRLGDCVPADGFNLLTAVSNFSGQAPGGVQFSDAEAQKVYSAIGGYVPGDPRTDNGSTLESWCGYAMTTGFTSSTGHVHKIAGWAEIREYNNLALLKQVANTFGAVYLGVSVGTADMTATNAGKPWTLPRARTNVGPNGIDHCVALVYSAYGYTPIWNDETVATWGMSQKMNINWAETNIGQAIVVVTPDWIAANGTTVEGLKLSQLLADSQNL